MMCVFEGQLFCQNKRQREREKDRKKTRERYCEWAEKRDEYKRKKESDGRICISEVNTQSTLPSKSTIFHRVNTIAIAWKAFYQ